MPPFPILKILPVAEASSYSRRTKDGFTIGITQPLVSYTRDSSERAMARLADRDAAAFEAVLIKRWRTPPPPVVSYRDVNDGDSWRRLGRLLAAGESAEPLITLWQRGELDPD